MNYIKNVYGSNVIESNISKFTFFYKNNLDLLNKEILSSMKLMMLENPIWYDDLYILEENIYVCKRIMCTRRHKDHRGFYVPFENTFNKTIIMKQSNILKTIAWNGYLTTLKRMRKNMLEPSSYTLNHRTYPPMNGFKENDLVEVFHARADGSHMGFWFYVARGSGVYLNVGKTIVFDNHDKGFYYFSKNCDLKNKNPRSDFNAYCAKQNGYDTIQYINFWEYGIYKPEILFVHLNVDSKWDNACFPSEMSNFLRAGWNGVHKCVCNEKLKYTNCEKTVRKLVLSTKINNVIRKPKKVKTVPRENVFRKSKRPHHNAFKTSVLK